MPQEYPNPEQVADDMDLFNVDRFGDAGAAVQNSIEIGFPADGGHIRCEYVVENYQSRVLNMTNRTGFSQDMAMSIMGWIATNIYPTEIGDEIRSHRIGIHVESEEVIGKFQRRRIGQTSGESHFVYRDGQIMETTISLPDEYLEILSEWAIKNLTPGMAHDIEFTHLAEEQYEPYDPTYVNWQ